MSKCVVTALLASVFLTGCGTFADLMCGPIGEGPRFYRGVWIDARIVQEGRPIAIVDMPLSAVADTLLIPSVIINNEHPEAPVTIRQQESSLQPVTGAPPHPLPPPPAPS
jgi:uncharacterized protein YceK